MKIAYVSDAIYPYNKGGKEKRLYDISTRLAQKGHEVHIYCMKWWEGNQNHRIENGVHLHSISPLYPLYTGERRSIMQALLFGICCLKLIKEDWDVIDVDHMPFYPVIFAKIVCLLKRKKMIATWNEVWGLKYWLKYLGWKGYIAYIVEKLSINLPDKIISIADQTSARLKKELIFKTPIETIAVGLDYEAIQKAIPSKEHYDVMYAGRIILHKNIDYIIKAISVLKEKYPNIKCLIVGNGPEENTLKILTDDLKLTENITFKNFFNTHNEVYAYMKSAKVFVYPSSREGFGIAPIEAHVAGSQVITVNEKDNYSKQIIKDFGIVTELDHNALAKSIVNSFTKEKPQLVTKYSWKEIMPLLVSEYER